MVKMNIGKIMAIYRSCPYMNFLMNIHGLSQINLLYKVCIQRSTMPIAAT